MSALMHALMSALTPALVPALLLATSCPAQAEWLAPAADGPALQLQYRLPALVDDGPDLALRLQAEAGESLVEAEVSQALGPVELFLGHARPLQPGRAAALWHANTAGLHWQVGDRHGLELIVEHARELRSGERDRRATLGYVYDGAGNTRWRVDLTRHAGDPADPWKASLGLVWAY